MPGLDAIYLWLFKFVLMAEEESRISEAYEPFYLIS